MKKSSDKAPKISSEMEVKALEKASQISNEFAGTLGNYSILVPEFAEMKRELLGKEINYGRSKRASAELAALIFDKNGIELAEREQKKNVEMFIVRTRSKISQLLNNPVWLKALEDHEEREDQRLDKEQQKVADMGLPGDLTRLIRKRFVADILEENGGKKTTFEGSPRNKVKLAEEMLVAPTERLVIRTNGKEDEKKALTTLVIDPGMVNDTLLKNLGLEAFVPAKKLSKLEKLKKRAEAIPAIIEKLGELRTVMPDEEDRLASKYYRSFATMDGYVVGTTNTSRGKQLFRANLIDAVNRLQHIEENQLAEIIKLRKFNSIVKNANFKIGNDWQQVKNSQEFDQIKADLRQLVESLKLVTNSFKKEMLELIEGCLTMESTYTRKVKDKQNGGFKMESVSRLNPSAKKAKLVMVPVKVDSRIEEIDRIGQHLYGDRVRLEAVKADHDLLPFRELRSYIEAMAEAKKLRQPANRKREKTSEENSPLGEKVKQDLIVKMKNWETEFSIDKRGQILEPYRTFVRKLFHKFEQAIALLKQEITPKQEVINLVTEIYLIAKLQTSWRSLQAIYERHLNTTKIPYFVELKNELVDLKRDILAKPVENGLKIDQFSPAFQTLMMIIDEMIKDSEEGKKNMKEKNEKKAYELQQRMHKAWAENELLLLIEKIK